MAEEQAVAVTNLAVRQLLLGVRLADTLEQQIVEQAAEQAAAVVDIMVVQVLSFSDI
jgi:hypothetical protein